MSGGMARAVEDFEFAFAQRNLVPPVQPLSGTEDSDWRESEGRALAGEGAEQKFVVPMGPKDGYPQMRRQGTRRTDMINMPMGQQNLCEEYVFFINQIQETLQVSARIDNSGLIGLIAPEEGAILLIRRDRENPVFKHENNL